MTRQRLGMRSDWTGHVSGPIFPEARKFSPRSFFLRPPSSLPRSLLPPLAFTLPAAALASAAILVAAALGCRCRCRRYRRLCRAEKYPDTTTATDTAAQMYQRVDQLLGCVGVKCGV